MGAARTYPTTGAHLDGSVAFVGHINIPMKLGNARGGLVVYAKVILHFELNLALCTECMWVAVI